MQRRSLSCTSIRLGLLPIVFSLMALHNPTQSKPSEQSDERESCTGQYAGKSITEPARRSDPNVDAECGSERQQGCRRQSPSHHLGPPGAFTSVSDPVEG